MTIAKKIEGFIEKSSWIRKMFEEGTRLKKQYGEENVFDFSLGNPNLPPPAGFDDILKEEVAAMDTGGHGYMPNTGYPRVRESIAGFVNKEQDVDLSGDDIVMTCGAAGALNIVFKAILDPGDEIISPTPFFVEYRFYVDNHGGVLKTVPTHDDFTLDLSAIEAAITAKTKAVIINSPNNPTGQVYSRQALDALGGLLSAKSRETGRPIYLISDEPYRKIAYDGITVPSIFGCYPETILCTSYSKDISIPGERIGFVAVNPAATYKQQLLMGIALANRILGFVNAPALMQRIVARMQGQSVDIDKYRQKRDKLCDILSGCGYEFTKPAGAFYLFPRAPIPDDVAFAQALQEEKVLVVPGSGFGGPGHIRIAYCVEDHTIENARPGFQRAMDKYR
ncbi:MAG: pyridoxal phosphate-dependent aminotransferase [Deltaproteobacteria bacterium]|nr:MAG: pyridoxal phosphate-dependent aminotransferase [Deltaproteobacteria bacterium]